MTTNKQDDGAPTKKGAWRSLKGNVMAMGLVSLFTDFSSEMMNPLLPIFIAGIVGGKWAALYVGLMEGIAETTAAILKIFSGRISDRLGKRKALVLWGYGLSSFARPLMALAGIVSAATGGLQVVVLKFFDRVGKGIRTAPRDALIGDSVPKENRGLAFSFHRSMDNLGAVLGPIVAILFIMLINYLAPTIWPGQAVDLWYHPKTKTMVPPTHEVMDTMRWLFALALIPGIAAMVALFWKVKEITPAAAKEHAKGSTVGLPRRFYEFVGIVTLFALGNSSDMFILLLGNQYFGLGLLQIMLLWIALHISKIIFGIPGGMLSDRIGRKPMIVMGWGIYAVVYLGLAFARTDQLWQFWGLVMLYGAYYGFTEGVEKALVADFIPSERRGTAFGIYHGAIGIAALPASLIFGLAWTWLVDTYPNDPDFARQIAFSIGAGLAGVSMILLAALLSTKEKTQG